MSGDPSSGEVSPCQGTAAQADPSSRYRHSSQTAGMAKIRTSRKTSMSRTLQETMRRMDHVPMVSFGSHRSSLRVGLEPCVWTGHYRRHECGGRSSRFAATVKVKNNLGPEYEWYPGCLVLSVFRLSMMALRLTFS